MNTPPALFEACVDSVISAINAIEGGAQRLELCDALVEGGVTPSHGKIVAVLRASRTVPVHVLVRPRGGDFVYSPEEFDVMLADVVHCKSLGVSGIVCGILLPDGSVDAPRTRQLIETARPMRFTFHRAIDAAADTLEAFKVCISLDVDYVLTSGGAPSALEGAVAIRQCVQLAAENRSARRTTDDDSSPRGVTVVAGGGIGNAATATAVVQATGARQLHGTARHLVDGASTFRRDPPVYMGGEKINSTEAEHGLRIADAAVIRDIVAQINRATTGTTLAES